MPSLYTELRSRNVFKIGAACTKMGRLRGRVNGTVNQCLLMAESRHSLICKLVHKSEHLASRN